MADKEITMRSWVSARLPVIQIKKRISKISQKYHPDVNPGDKKQKLSSKKQQRHTVS